MHKHREIYRTLLREILDGQYSAIQRLPSEAQLVRRFGVSRPTAARALRELQSEGVIERRVGSGSFLTGVQPSTTESSRHLGVLLPALDISEVLDFVCQELASLTRSRDYSLLWANSKPPADLTVKDAEDVCKLVANDEGWPSVPPGTRKSTYDTPEYQKAPFAAVTLEAMQTADPTNPCIKKVPYFGIQFVGIPEFQALGTQIGQNIAAVLAGRMSVDQALKTSQGEAKRTAKEGGYLK
jgi:DNA-binding transcriptional regulator YhcF (GntR family)